jgi:hypothetical protein
MRNFTSGTNSMRPSGMRTTPKFSPFSARDDRGYDLVDYLAEAHLPGLDLLGDEADVGPGLEGALEGDVRGRAAHELDEVPVLAARGGVAADVADQLGVDLRGRVEAEGSLDDLVLEVAVDGLGHADHRDALALGREELGEEGRIGIGVVAADHDHGVELAALGRLEGLLELLRRLDLRASRADEVEAARVPVPVHELGVDVHALVVDEAPRAAAEAEELGSGLADLRPSKMPAITLWPPGAGPPERMTPIFIAFRMPGLSPSPRVT